MPDTAVELDFAAGRYRFWLPMPQIIELERVCGIRADDGRVFSKSVFVMYDEMSRGMMESDDGTVVYADGGASHPLDVNETLRLGLIGGGSGMVNGAEVKVGPNTARQLVAEYGYPAVDLASATALAWSVLHAAINGVRLKKKAHLESDGAIPIPIEKAAS